MNIMRLNVPLQHPRSMEKLSPMKLVPKSLGTAELHHTEKLMHRKPLIKGNVMDGRRYLQIIYPIRT